MLYHFIPITYDEISEKTINILLPKKKKKPSMFIHKFVLRVSFKNVIESLKRLWLSNSFSTIGPKFDFFTRHGLDDM